MAGVFGGGELLRSSQRNAGESGPLLLVVGQMPPPVHGSNVMAAELVAALDRMGVPKIFVDKRLSRRIEDVGRFQPEKIVRSLWLVCRAAVTVLTRPSLRTCIYFLSCSSGAFLVDAVLVELLRALGLNVVPYLHGIGFQALAGSGNGWRRIVARLFRRSKCVVVLSADAGRDVSEWIDMTRIVTIPNSIPDIIDGRTADRRQPRDSCRFTFISTLERTKGALEFARAACDVLPECPQAEFVIAGQSCDASVDAELREVLNATGPDGRLRLLGPVYGDAKAELLRDSDVFVFPTTYRFENQPLVVLEAMRAGLPVVATRIGSIPTQIEDGISGILVTPGEVRELAARMRDLYVDRSNRERMGRAARRRFVELFSQPSFDERWASFVATLPGSATVRRV